jgi:hypothetical protein
MAPTLVGTRAVRVCICLGLPATLPLQSKTSRSESAAEVTAMLFDAPFATAISFNSLAGANPFQPYAAFSTILRI